MINLSFLVLGVSVAAQVIVLADLGTKTRAVSEDSAELKPPPTPAELVGAQRRTAAEWLAVYGANTAITRTQGMMKTATGERIVGAFPVALLETRSVVKGTGFAGLIYTIPIFKGLRIKTGYFAHGQNRGQRLTPIAHGDLFVTTKGVTFLSASVYSGGFNRTIGSEDIARVEEELSDAFEEGTVCNHLIGFAKRTGKTMYVSSQYPGEILAALDFVKII